MNHYINDTFKTACTTGGYKIVTPHILFIDCDHPYSSHVEEIITFLEKYQTTTYYIDNITYKLNFEVWKTNKGYHILSVLPNKRECELVNQLIVNSDKKICSNSYTHKPDPIERLDRIRTFEKRCSKCLEVITQPTGLISSYNNDLDEYNKADSRFWSKQMFITYEYENNLDKHKSDCEYKKLK